MGVLFSDMHGALEAGKLDSDGVAACRFPDFRCLPA
jgi:hypothetical protein